MPMNGRRMQREREVRTLAVHAVVLCLTFASAGIARAAQKESPLLAPARALASEIERGEHRDVESFILMHRGQVLARAVAAGLAERAPDLRSTTKSITALLIGIAIDRGEIASVDVPILELLPARAARLGSDRRKAKITIRDLLTMRSGLDCDDWNRRSPGHEDKMYRRGDWVDFWARQSMLREPGAAFSYCTGNVIALGEILKNASGMPADEYAGRHLFAPLGIAQAQWARWNKGRGIDTGGHLRLAPDDFLKIGRLVLERGVSPAGERLVSQRWLEEMTRPHAAIPEQRHQYGYLWWVHRVQSPALPQTDLWWAQGNGGSFLIVMPGVDAVLAVTGTRFNRPDANEPMLWLRDRLLPALVDRPTFQTPRTGDE